MNATLSKTLGILGICLLGVFSFQPSALAQLKPTPNPAMQNLPIVGANWRSEGDLPWSQLVRIQEPEGEYIGVIDRDYPTGMNLVQFRHTGLLSNWNRQNIQLYSYYTHRSCVTVFFVPICNTSHPIGPVDFAQIKVESQIFDLAGDTSYFKLPNTLAKALRNTSPGQLLIRFSPRDSGDLVVRMVGSDTIKAWKVLYQDLPAVDTEVEPQSHPVPTNPPVSATLPIVDGRSWRYTDDLPWSVPVKVQDPFDGDYLAVLDSEFSGGALGLKTNWSLQRVQFHVFTLGGNVYRSEEVKAVTLKLGDRAFELTGERNQFAIDAELAMALRNAPLDQVFVKFTDRKGEQIEHKIGNGTIQSWRTIYQVKRVNTM